MKRWLRTPILEIFASVSTCALIFYTGAAWWRTLRQLHAKIWLEPLLAKPVWALFRSYSPPEGFRDVAETNYMQLRPLSGKSLIVTKG
jgi:hypothetical protein